MISILIHNGHVLTMDDDHAIHDPGWVRIEGDRIVAVGNGAPPAGLAQADRVIDATNMAVLPGLVNAHTHLSQTFMRGLGDDMRLLDWLRQVVWPLQAAMTPDEMHLASLLGLVENLRCGVTAVVQHHKLPRPAHLDATLHAARTVGVRLRLARGWADVGDGAETPDAIVDSLTTLYQRWHGAEAGRITVASGPLVPWRCSPETMRRTLALTRGWGLTTHIHVAETRDEVELMRARTGFSHVEWLYGLSALGPDIQLVHGVHVSEAELALVADAGAAVVHCPTSNMVLASGIAPVPAMLRRGIPVALGTDGSASHNSQDLLETLKTAALLAKVGAGDATALTNRQALEMVTRAGALILGRDDLGQLRPGFKADLTLVNLDRAHIVPVHRVDSALIYNCNGPDVDTVIVDGRILLDRGRVTVCDEAALLAECRSAAQSLVERAQNASLSVNQSTSPPVN